jgi:hypothetical protein
MFLLLMNPTFANVINYETDSFADIATKFEELHVDPKTTLMLFDLDDTLITMTEPLGSVGWWDWQSELLKHNPQSEKLFTSDFQQLVRIQNILFQLIKMRVTDDHVLPFLQQKAAQGVTLMGLTARGKEHLSATLMQLNDNKFTVDGKLLFEQYGLKINNKTSIAGNFHCPHFSKDVIYQRGVMFLDGEDKGQSALCVLANTQQNINTIIFVDDAKRNVVSMEKAFANENVRVLNVFYTRENGKELEIQNNAAIQAKLIEQWNSFKKNLNEITANGNF